MEILIDTSFLIKKLERERDIGFFEQNTIYVSIMTIYEYLMPKKNKLKEKLLLENLLKVLNITNEIIVKAAEIKGRLYRKGKPISEIDYFIAATALVHNLELWTLNKDFLKVKEEFPELKLKLFNP